MIRNSLYSLSRMSREDLPGSFLPCFSPPERCPTTADRRSRSNGIVAVLRRESTGGCASGLAPAETAPTSSANSPTSPDAGSLAARRRTRLSGRGWQDFSALRRRLAAHGRARCGRTPRPGDVDRLDVLHHDVLCLRPDPTIPFLSLAGPMRASALATIRSSAGVQLGPSRSCVGGTAGRTVMGLNVMNEGGAARAPGVR